MDEQNYASEYFSLSSETYVYNGIFWEEQTSTDIFAAFSMPSSNVKNQRGYISYCIAVMREGCIVDSWSNFTHQNGWLQYHAMIASQDQMRGLWGNNDLFTTVQDALQFYAKEDEIKMVS